MKTEGTPEMDCSERKHRALYDAAMAIVHDNPRLSRCYMSWKDANELRHLNGCCPFRELMPMVEAEIMYGSGTKFRKEI